MGLLFSDFDKNPPPQITTAIIILPDQQSDLNLITFNCTQMNEHLMFELPNSSINVQLDALYSVHVIKYGM